MNSKQFGKRMLLHRYFAVFMAMSAVGLFSQPAAAVTSDDILTCRSQTSPSARLRCYDRIPSDETSSISGQIGHADEDIPVSLVNADFRIENDDFPSATDRPRIDLFLAFHNSSEKTIVAISGVLRIEDSFGKEIVSKEKNLNIRIEPGNDGNSQFPESWEDDRFQEDHPYERLFGAVNAGLANVSMTITELVYDDGTSEYYYRQ